MICVLCEPFLMVIAHVTNVQIDQSTQVLPLFMRSFLDTRADSLPAMVWRQNLRAWVFGVLSVIWQLNSELTLSGNPQLCANCE